MIVRREVLLSDAKETSAFSTEVVDFSRTPWESIRERILLIEKACFGAGAYSEKRLRTHMENPSAVTMIMKDAEGVIVGFAYTLPEEDVPDSAWIQSIDIHPELQSRGLGGRLMSDLEDRADETDQTLAQEIKESRRQFRRGKSKTLKDIA